MSTNPNPITEQLLLDTLITLGYTKSEGVHLLDARPNDIPVSSIDPIAFVMTAIEMLPFWIQQRSASPSNNFDNFNNFDNGIDNGIDNGQDFVW